MNRFQKATFLLLVSITLTDCELKVKDSTIPSLSFHDVSQSIDLRLTDIITDLQLVALETVDEALVGDVAKILFSKNNIIVITKDQILQFNRKGKFVKSLANAGRGPNEFSNLTHYQIDREERNFYYLQWPNNKVHRIDLASGKHRDPILFSENIQAETFALIDKNRIAIFPHISVKTDYLVFYQDTLGNILDGIEAKREGTEPNLYTFLNPVKMGSKYFFQHSKICGDTVFIIDGVKKEPYFIIKEKDKIEASEEITEGYLTRLIPFSPTFWVFQNQEILKKGASYTFKIKFYLALDKEFNLYEISSFSNDLTGSFSYGSNIVLVFANSFYNDTESGTAGFLVAAHKLLKMLDSEMIRDLSPENQNLLKSIEGKVTENDNPILIIGKINDDATKTISSRQE